MVGTPAPHHPIGMTACAWVTGLSESAVSVSSRGRSVMASRDNTPRHEQPVILASAVTIIEAALERRGIGLAAPLGVRFRTDERGSSGIEVIITLREPHRAAAAR